MKNTKVVCFANNKGGSGKSTSCSNTGHALSVLGKKVLLIDGDMQLNLSLSFFPEEEVLNMAKSEKNLYYAVKEQKDFSDYIMHTAYENVDLIPSSTLMSSIEFELFTKWQREFIVKKCLSSVKEAGIYDYIFIDAPPTLGCWVMNLLAASDYLIIPVEASPWGLFGLANMFEFLDSVKELTPDLSVLGILITKVDVRKNYFKQTIDSLKELEDIPVFHSHIRIDSAIEWAQDNSKPVLAYRKGARSAVEYLDLAKEVDRNARRKR